MSVVVFTEWGDNYKEIAAISLPVFEKYCKRHGYIFSPLYLIDDNNYAFRKHEYIKELFKMGYDAIWYLDVDALITNHSINVTKFIDDENDFFITKDFNELNGGSIIIKNNIGGFVINNTILFNRNDWDNEQNLINKMYVDNLHKMKILAHPSINSYDYSLYPECKEYVGREDLGDWQPGNFVIHFPGLSLEKRLELMKQYSQKIIE